MKLVLVMFTMFVAQAGYAFDYSCTKVMKTDVTRESKVSTWPDLNVVVDDITKCEQPTSGKTASCSKKSGARPIASNVEVCYRPVYITNCTITETTPTGLGNDRVEVACSNGSTLIFETDAQSLGKISCMEDGVTRKVWDVGQCEPIN